MFNNIFFHQSFETLSTRTAEHFYQYHILQLLTKYSFHEFNIEQELAGQGAGE